MPNVIKMRGSGHNGFQRKNSKVGKHDWHLDPFGGHRNGHFHHKNTTPWPKQAKFYNLVRTITKAMRPDYVKDNDERDTFISKLEVLL